MAFKPGYRKFIEKYFDIITKNNEVKPFELNPIQSKFLEEADSHRDVILKARQQGFCVDPKTRILMADLTWKFVDKVKVGDEIVAVDEFPKDGRGMSRELKTAVVEAKSNVYEDRYCIQFESGKSLVATPDHRFLSHIRGSSGTLWRKVKKLKAGDEIRYITDTWDGTSLEDAWVGGMIDGEAHFRRKRSGGVELHISQVDNKAWQKLLRWAENNNFHYRIDWDRRGHRERKPVGGITFNRINEIFEIIGRTRPVRHIDKHWWEGKSLPGKRSGKAWDKIVKIAKMEKGRMIDLQTSEKTFIADGYVSHNSSMILAIFATDFLVNEYTHNVIVADSRENAQGLLERVKFYIESYELKKSKQTGQVFKIPMKYNTRYELYNEATKSKYTVGTAGNVEFGRSKTISNLHFSEAAFYPDFEKLLASAMQAVTPNGRVIVETTANGFNFFKDFWEECENKKRPFKPSFYNAQDFYDEAFLKQREAELGRMFKQEYPRSAPEAFLASGDTYFDRDALDFYIKNCIEPIREFPYGFYDFI